MSNPGVWKTWEGRTVDGRFPLRRWLGGSEHSAVFLTEWPTQRPQKAAIKFITADEAEFGPQLSRWRAAAQLSHPNLMRILDAGRCRLDGAMILYLVMDYAEEDLSQILPHRPLVPGEATDMLPPLLEAISYLHNKGFVHGRIKPSNVLAVGDQLKLSPDQVASTREVNSARRRRDVYDAPETAAGIISPAGDIWSVGVTLVAALTQNVSFAKEGAQGDPSLPETLPQPFRGIARECLHLDPKRRCSIAEIQARLQPAGRSVPAEGKAPPDPGRPVKCGPIVVAAMAAVLLISLILFFMRAKSVPTPATSTTEQHSPQSAPAPPPESTARQPVAAPKKSVASPPRKSVASQGTVVHQTIPDVPQSAKNTITGTIKVDVRVEVAPSGKVTTARLKSAGPSKYFAGLALKAAQRWEFSALGSDGQPAESAWLLQFRFRRTSTQASAVRMTH